MTYRLEATAHNTHPESYNPIHSEEARALGFEGGIVPGVTLYGYFVTLIIQTWGEGWLENGSLNVRFTKPVYDGDAISCLLDIGLDAEVAMLTMLNEHRQTVVTGLARRLSGVAPPILDNFPKRSAPERRVLADVATLADNAPLVEKVVETSEADQTHWLRRADNLEPPFGSLIHPVVMARVTSDLVDDIYEVRGGRVLRTLKTTLFGTRELGAVIRARGAMSRAWSDRGRDLMAVDVLLVDEADRTVMYVQTESIFNLGVAVK